MGARVKARNPASITLRFLVALLGAGCTADPRETADDTADAGSSENTYVARVSAKSAATAGSRVELALDTSKLTLFDPATGRNLSLAQ